MKNSLIALMIYGEPGSPKTVFTEDKYKRLVGYLIEKEFTVDSVLYHDSKANTLANELPKYNAILVWVNPIEKGTDRKVLDTLLKNLSLQGCFVSAHPDTISKMGTKEILYEVRETEFGGDVKLYRSFDDFKDRFLKEQSGIRILKQYRGNGGNGVYKVDLIGKQNNKIDVTHATKGDEVITYTVDNFFEAFKTYFDTGSMLIDQAWNNNIINGMVRCYLSGTKVAGFGYQEINALYPITGKAFKKPSQRFYYSEDCGLFRDLKQIMENKWVPQLQRITGLKDEMLPVIWDADFFINKINTEITNEKYSLCEINVSSVSPFPESAIPFIVDEVQRRINKAGEKNIDKFLSL